MIRYDTGKWNISFACQLYGSVFPKAFCWAFPASVFATVLNIVFNRDEEIASRVGAGDVGTNILSGFTFILGFLIVFRSQVAYSRWWEGGTLLQKVRGEWFNAYSSLMAFCNTSEMKRGEVREFQHHLVRLISLLYASALQQLGKDCMRDKSFELICIAGLDPESIAFLEKSTDRCEIVLQWIQRLIVDANNSTVIKIAPPILARVYNQLGNGIVGLNNARKIAEYNIPFCLAQMITFMLLIHLGLTPIICASTVQTPYWAGCLTFVVIFSYWSINYIATELEIPYGDEPNDLPMADMQRDLNISLKQLLDPQAMEPPSFSFNLEWHSQLITEVVDLDETLTDDCEAAPWSTFLNTQALDAKPCQEEKQQEKDKQFSIAVSPPVDENDLPTPCGDCDGTGKSSVGQVGTCAQCAGTGKKAQGCNLKMLPPTPQPAASSAKANLAAVGSDPAGLATTLAPDGAKGGPRWQLLPSPACPPVMEPWVVKVKATDDLTGVTQVMDVFSEDLVNLAKRMENHLARIAYEFPQMAHDVHAAAVSAASRRDSSLERTPKCRSFDSAEIASTCINLNARRGGAPPDDRRDREGGRHDVRRKGEEAPNGDRRSRDGASNEAPRGREGASNASWRGRSNRDRDTLD